MSLKITESDYASSEENGWPKITIVCPACGAYGTFHNVGADTIIKDGDGNYAIGGYGLRLCPNKECHTIIIAEFNDAESVQRTYPSSSRAVNLKDVPPKVAAAFEEAVACFSSNFYVASAIMIRKTLEEICSENNANGKNLKLRIDDLSTKIVIPLALKNGMHELRLLGNDAAHVESHVFEEIGENELSISIDFTQEIIKALYQHQDLLKRLQSLKKPTQQINQPPQ